MTDTINRQRNRKVDRQKTIFQKIEISVVKIKE